jgi:hypothetical protein
MTQLPAHHMDAGTSKQTIADSQHNKNHPSVQQLLTHKRGESRLTAGKDQQRWASDATDGRNGGGRFALS